MLSNNVSTRFWEKWCKMLLGRFRSSLPEVFLVKGVLKICSKFTGEHIFLEHLFLRTPLGGCFWRFHVIDSDWSLSERVTQRCSVKNKFRKPYWSLLLQKLQACNLQLYQKESKTICGLVNFEKRFFRAHPGDWLCTVEYGNLPKFSGNRLISVDYSYSVLLRKKDFLQQQIYVKKGF